MAIEIPKKYIINRQGKDYVLYAGLLNAAHDNGLRGITTNLVQVGSPSNGNVTIVHAVITMADPDAPEKTLTFTGLGEVNHAKDTPIALSVPVRMAETRAKGRAFRDALNASDYTLEGEDDGDHPAPEHPKRDTPAFPRTTPARALPDEGPAESPLPVRSIKDVLQEAQTKWPDKVQQGAAAQREARTAHVDGRPEHDRGDDYRGDHSVAKRPTEYDTDPEKLDNAHKSWDELAEKAVAVGITVQQPTPDTWSKVSLMRAAWAKLNREVRAKSAPNSPGTPVAPVPDAPVDDAPPPERE